MRDCRCRTTWRCSSYRPRYNCRRPTTGRRTATSDLRGGSADASSAGSKPAMCRRTAIPPLAQNRGVALNCAPRKCPRSATIRRQMWRSRSLIIQAACGTLGATERFIPHPSNEKGDAGALAGPGYYGYGPGYGPGYGYYGGPAYVADDYCVWQRQRFWDGYGWRVRRVRVCG